MKLLLPLALLVIPTAASALHVGTNDVDFAFAGTGLSAESAARVGREIERLLDPSASVSVCLDCEDGWFALDGYSLPPTIDPEAPFEVGRAGSDRIEVPVVASFASNLLARIDDCEAFSNELSSAEAFRTSLDSALVESDGIAFIATNFVSKRFGTAPIPMSAATNMWMRWRTWVSHPIPLSGFGRRPVGPDSSDHLWSYVPMNTGTSVFWLPIVFIDNRWRFSLWDYEEHGYDWQ